MKAVILAGGFGTRISEESHLKPKPMIEIGGHPILWHIMKLYYAQGIREFVICLGYKGYIIKEYFANYFLHMSDVTFDMEQNKTYVHHEYGEKWRVTLVDTGENTMTGGRLLRVREYLGDEPFYFTYGDGVADINLAHLLQFHREAGKLVTLTAIQPPGRYGSVEIDHQTVQAFEEKPLGDGAWVNGGFFVVNPRAIDYIAGDQSSWEADALTRIVKDGQLAAYKHTGFWQSMDTLRDKVHLEQKWASGNAPWKNWK